MNSKTLLKLLIVAVVVIASALFLQSRNTSSVADEGELGLLYPQLNNQLDAVGRLALYRAGQEQPTLSFALNEYDQWVVEQRGYPMNFDMLRKLLQTLSTAETSEQMTSNPEYYSRLGVRDIEDEASTARAIRITAKDGSSLGKVLFGETTPRGGVTSTYVRREGEAESWLVAGVVNMPEFPERWLARTVIDIPFTEVSAALVFHPDGSQLHVTKADAEAETFTITDFPEGEELLYPAVANTVAEALTNLQLEDVIPASEFEFTAGSLVGGEYKLFNGMEISARSEQRGTEYFVQFAVEYPGDDAEVQARVDALRSVVDGWVYKILPHSYKLYAKRIDDLLKRQEEGPQPALPSLPPGFSMPGQ